MALMMLPVFMSWIIFYASVKVFLEPAFYQGIGMNPEVNQEVMKVKAVILERFDLLFLVNVGFALVLLFPLGTMVTNRLAGPMYRLRVFLREKKSGPFPKFRKSDFFSDLPQLIDEYLKSKSQK